MKCRRILFPALVSMLAGLFCSAPAAAQVLALFPTCGKVGDTVKVCGSGWAEPSPGCYYTFLFDGPEVASRQPDGLFGPPNRSFIVPMAAVGNHMVTVELRLSSDDSLLQSKTEPFKVIDGSDLPISATSPSTGNIDIQFDPSKGCITGDCDEIVFLQTRNPRRIRMNGSDTHLPYNEAPHQWPHGTEIEATFVNDIAIDRIYGRPVPYYGLPGGAATVGKSIQGGAMTNATMQDEPKRGDDSYFVDPMDANNNVVTLAIHFDVHAYCAKGDAAGAYLGHITWSWSRNKGRVDGMGMPDFLGDVTIGAADTMQPSAAFLAALNAWIAANPGFKLPMSKFPGCI